jgi:hypothetical protein
MLSNKKRITLHYFLNKSFKICGQHRKESSLLERLAPLALLLSVPSARDSRGGASRRRQISSELISAYLRFVGFEDLTAVIVMTL